MKLSKVAGILVLALTAGFSLTACGSTAPVPAVTVTASPAPTTPAATTPAAAAQPAPAKTVYVAPAAPAQPAAPAMTNCGGGVDVPNPVWAGANTSCSFALNTAQAWHVAYLQSGYADNTVTAYSPVTGQNYTMSCTEDSVAQGGSGDLICTGGNNAYVQF